MKERRWWWLVDGSTAPAGPVDPIYTPDANSWYLQCNPETSNPDTHNKPPILIPSTPLLPTRCNDAKCDQKEKDAIRKAKRKMRSVQTKKRGPSGKNIKRTYLTRGGQESRQSCRTQTYSSLDLPKRCDSRASPAKTWKMRARERERQPSTASKIFNSANILTKHYHLPQTHPDDS